MEDDPIFDKEYTASMAGCPGAVGYHEYGLSGTVHCLKNAQESVCCPGVQGSGGLICQKQPRLCDQSAGHCRPLLLSAGYLVREFFQKVLNFKLLCKRRKAFLHFMVILSCQNHGKENIILD